MQDSSTTITQPLANLSKRDWLYKLIEITKMHGAFQPLGKRHLAAFLEGEEDTDTLIVTFETVQGIRALTEAAQPLGWSFAQTRGWAHLCFASDGDTWFRDDRVFEHIDTLTDEGFFDVYDRVLFYGAGPCAYAAAAFSVAAPGSTVLMIQPQATLAPRIAGWDNRFSEQRRVDFSNRYGYAPDMIDAARAAYLIYDPFERLDAMHAALFTKPHVTMLPVRHMGDAIQSDFLEMDILLPLLAECAMARLTPESFAQHYRARRNYPPYLHRVMAHLDAQDRPELVSQLAQNVTSRMKAPRFQRRLSELEAALGKAPADR